MTYDMARYTDRMHDACLKVMYLLVAALLCIRQERRDATQRNASFKWPRTVHQHQRQQKFCRSATSAKGAQLIAGR